MSSGIRRLFRGLTVTPDETPAATIEEESTASEPEPDRNEEPVQPPAAPKAQPRPKAKAKVRPPRRGVTPAVRRSCRYYTIYKWRQAPGWCGIYLGTWQEVLDRVLGQPLAGSGASLRGHDTETEARATWEQFNPDEEVEITDLGEQ